MAITIVVNGESISYPQTGDTGWGGQATEFAEQTASAFGALGLSSGTTVDIPGTLDVTGNTTLDANLSVGGNTTLTGNITVNGNSNLGNGTSDTTAITGILNVDSGVLYVDPISNKVGINDTTPSVELDVNGSVAITGNETIGGTLGVTGATTLSNTLGVTGDVAVNTNKFNVTASSGNTTIAGTLGVTGNTTLTGQALASDGTALLPGISFSSDPNTGLFRSASDQLDIVTGGDTRFRVESTGQIKAVYESTLGTDYNTSANLANGYLCRAWVNFDGTSSNLTGTYSRTGTTITVSITSHGLTTGQSVYLDFTTGTATDGIYIVTVVNANSYTVTDTVSGSTSGNVTQFRYIRASGNVSSITDNGTGEYSINFTTAMPDANYSCIITTNTTSTANYIFNYAINGGFTPSTSSIRIFTYNTAAGALADVNFISLAVFR